MLLLSVRHVVVVLVVASVAVAVAATAVHCPLAATVAATSACCCLCAKRAAVARDTLVWNDCTIYMIYVCTVNLQVEFIGRFKPYILVG